MSDAFIPDDYRNIKVSNLVKAQDQHQMSNLQFTQQYGALKVSLENLRKNHHAHSRGRRQSSDVKKNVKFSNFRYSAHFGISVSYIPTEAFAWGQPGTIGGNDSGKLRIRSRGGSGGPWCIRIGQSAGWNGSDGTVDIQNSTGGYTNTTAPIGGWSSMITAPNSNTQIVVNMGGSYAYATSYNVECFDIGSGTPPASDNGNGRPAFMIDFAAWIPDVAINWWYRNHDGMHHHANIMPVRELNSTWYRWQMQHEYVNNRTWSEEFHINHPGNDAVWGTKFTG